MKYPEIIERQVYIVTELSSSIHLINGGRVPLALFPLPLEQDALFTAHRAETQGLGPGHVSSAVTALVVVHDGHAGVLTDGDARH